MEEQRALADKVEAMKEVNVFLTNHVQELAELRMSSLEALGSLDAEHVSLTQQIDQMSETQHMVSLTNLKSTTIFLAPNLNRKWPVYKLVMSHFGPS